MKTLFKTQQTAAVFSVGNRDSKLVWRAPALGRGVEAGLTVRQTKVVAHFPSFRCNQILTTVDSTHNLDSSPLPQIDMRSSQRMSFKYNLPSKNFT